MQDACLLEAKHLAIKPHQPATESDRVISSLDPDRAVSSPLTNPPCVRFAQASLS